jgi:hypothetical protein
LVNTAAFPRHPSWLQFLKSCLMSPTPPQPSTV